MATLEFDALSKEFPGVRALDQVTFEAESGTVHALCGENGAGKSTLLKILSGVYTPDGGSFRIEGKTSQFQSASQAIGAGVSVIYQELNMVPHVSVAENIFLGHLPCTGPLVDKKRLIEQAAAALEKVGLAVDPRTPLEKLPIAQQQMVEIAKALSHDAKVIAFDEPTSSLTNKEVEHLFGLIRSLREQGKVILYVSHRMDEVTALSDACTVLRDGKHVVTWHDMQGVTSGDIVAKMVGRDIDDVFGYKQRPVGEPVLQAQVSGEGLSALCDVEIRAGEIVGIFGLVGAGRTELLKAIYQGDGQVTVSGKSVPRQGPRASITSGIVFCPEDRKREGIIPQLSVAENINLSVRRTFSRFGWINVSKEQANAEEKKGRLQIKAPTIHTKIQNLSGGNQQKAILARWLSEEINVILLDEPTRGIDVGAKAEIYEIINGLAANGAAVLLVSSELPEVMGVSDRIIVMCGGKIAGELPREQFTEQALLELALPKGDAA